MYPENVCVCDSGSFHMLAVSLAVLLCSEFSIPTQFFDGDVHDTNRAVDLPLTPQSFCNFYFDTDVTSGLALCPYKYAHIYITVHIMYIYVYLFIIYNI